MGLVLLWSKLFCPRSTTMRIIVCLFVFCHTFFVVFLRRHAQASGYFWTLNFSFRTQKFPCPHVSGYKTNLPVHTYPDIFESAIFSLLGPSWIFNIHSKELVDLLTRFEIHRGLKNLHFGERIQKVADSSAGYTGYAWTEAESGDSKYPDTCERGLNWYSETPLCDMVMYTNSVTWAHMSDVCVFGLYSQAKPYVVYVMSIVGTKTGRRALKQQTGFWLSKKRTAQNEENTAFLVTVNHVSAESIISCTRG